MTAPKWASAGTISVTECHVGFLTHPNFSNPCHWSEWFIKDQSCVLDVLWLWHLVWGTKVECWDSVVVFVSARKFETAILNKKKFYLIPSWWHRKLRLVMMLYWKLETQIFHVIEEFWQNIALTLRLCLETTSLKRTKLQLKFRLVDWHS